MGDVLGAARRTDLTNHEKVKAQAVGKIAVAAVEAAKTAYTVYRIAKVGAAFVPGVGWGALALSFVVDWAVSEAIEYGVAKLVEKKSAGHPEIKPGSPNVFTNKLNNARGGGQKDDACCGQKVQQGSEWVSINKLPAARLDDMTTRGHICTASKNVGIGGPPTDYNPHQTLERVLLVLSLYNNMKKGGIEAAVKGTSVWKGLGSGVVDTVKDEITGAAKDQVKDTVGGALQDSGYLPW
jgi:uncharacterized Zn-binding protein involved in type VI secretion